MALATGAQTQVIWVDEDIDGAGTWGTTPATPAMIEVPYTSVNVNPTKESFASELIRSDRQTQNIRHGFQSVDFSLETEMVTDDFDTWIQYALFSSTTVSAGAKAGTLRNSISVEIGYTDIAQYLVVTGVMFNSMTLTVNANDPIAKISFSGIGKGWGSGFSGTSADASPTAAANGAPMGGADAAILEGGGAIAIVTGVEMTIENGLEPARVIQATPQAAALQEGRTRVSGRLDAYFEDAVLLNKFLNETETDLQVTVDDGTNNYAFFAPAIKYNGGEAPVDGEGGLVIGLPFEGFYDATEATSFKVTKT